MNWQSQWGDKIEFLKGIEEDTGETPPALLARPILSQFEQPYMDAFNILSGSRQWTMGGPAAIPFSEIAAYLEFNHIDDPDEREEYITMIRSLDAEYLKISAAKVKK